MAFYWAHRLITCGVNGTSSSETLPTTSGYEPLEDSQIIYNGATGVPGDGAGTTSFWVLWASCQIAGTPSPIIRLQDVTNAVTLLSVTLSDTTATQPSHVIGGCTVDIFTSTVTCVPMPEPEVWWMVRHNYAADSGLTLPGGRAAFELQLSYAGGATTAKWQSAGDHVWSFPRV